MKKYAICHRLLVFAAIVFGLNIAHAQTEITYDVTGFIDTADLLIIHGSEVQWHHPGGGAAVGRHSGGNVATTISSTLNDVTNFDDFAWIPTWPEDPPAEIRYDAYSSVLDNLSPALPSESMAVDVSVLAGRGSASIEQFPVATNDWTLIVRFADGAAGSASLSVHISVELVPLNIVPIDPRHWQIQWPTNAPSFQLESAPGLSATDDWTVVTNEPVVQGKYFTVPIDATKSQQFFRLHKL